jgi:hypothetical protein
MRRQPTLGERVSRFLVSGKTNSRLIHIVIEIAGSRSDPFKDPWPLCSATPAHRIT